MTQQQDLEEISSRYGLVNHVPSGEVYVMRFVDGAVSGPLHYSEHRKALSEALDEDFDDEDTEWARQQDWENHNLDGSCRGCNG